MTSRPPLSDAERRDWLRLIRTDNIGPRTFQALMGHYRTARRALEVLPDLARRGGARSVKVTSIAEAEREMDAAARLGVRFVASCEPDYPATLAAIDAGPPLIAVRGKLDVLQRPIVSVVGSRNASASGLAFTERLVRGLARAGFVVASGLARGIDLRAHQASLETGTIAVLAGGHDLVYPPDHEPLLRRILEAGAALSEMPMGWEARGRDFPRRNRIVSGLAHATVVVEAARRSGSLITARFANEQGREVFAVPGSPLDPRAEGTNDLLRQGASLCTRAEDVIDTLAPHLDGAPARRGEPRRGRLGEERDVFDTDGRDADAGQVDSTDDPELDRGSADGGGDVVRRVSALLGPSPVGIDEIVRSARAHVREVQQAILELELAGRLTRHAGNLVSRTPEA